MINRFRLIGIALSVFTYIAGFAQCFENDKLSAEDRVFPNPNDSDLTVTKEHTFEFSIGFYAGENEQLQVDSITGLPDGTDFTCIDDCVFSGNPGCVTLSGKGTSTGTYTILFHLTELGTGDGITYNFTLKVNEPSNVEEVNADKLVFSAYPNPVKTMPTFAFNSSISRAGRITIYDQTGKLIDDFSVHLNRGITRFNYYADKLTSGFYHVVFEADDKREYVKLIVLN